MVTPEGFVGLENLASLSNTWWIDNEDRNSRDSIEQWAADHGIVDVAALRQFRDELRGGIERPAAIDDVGNAWIARYHIIVGIDAGTFVLRSDDDAVALLATTLVDAVRYGVANRLKACPDCRWVFVDQTRNNSRRWCVMNATGPLGRSCGNIAKARRHRQRRVATEET